MSDGGRWQEIDRVFSKALELPPRERHDFVLAECASDEGLAASVLELLDASDDDRFLRADGKQHAVRSLLAQAAKGSAPDDHDALLGAELGPYRVSRVLGRGGMGTVYLAERISGFDQQVAIKTLRRGVDTEDVVGRFLAERQILAQLEHPNIAKLLDGGATPDGRPYFAMEFVRGETITEYADSRDLPMSGRLELLRTVAYALDHAHRHLVVHRDLKPSNVLVTHEGVVKLLDFGIARIIGTEHRWGQTRTSTGLRFLTPAYAAPEQVVREPVTTATDVYQLGALTYELLSGARPFSRELSEHELERQIVDIEPPLPSRAARRAPDPAVAVHRGLESTEALSRALRGDLDVIASTALAKDPGRRYASIRLFADDIDLHLRGRPISARPATVGYRFGRFTKRNRWFLPGAAAAVALLSLYVGSSIRHDRELTAERNVAVAEADRARAVTEFLSGLFNSANPWTGGAGVDVTVLEALDQGAARVEAEFADRPALQAELLEVIGGSFHGLTRYEKAEELRRRAVMLRAGDNGLDAIETKEAQRGLANTLYYTAGADSAFSVLEPLTVELPAASESSEQLLRASAIGDLAWMHWQISQFDTALALFEEADRSFQAVGTRDPVRHGLVLQEHARALGQADRAHEQIVLARRAVELLESGLPADHIQLAAARGDLGAALSNVGRYEDAIAQFDQVLPVFDRLLESFDTNLLTERANRAYALIGLERLSEAESEYQTIVKLLAAEDPGSKAHGDALQNLAGVKSRRGKSDEAIVLSMQAHQIYQRQLGMHYLTAFPLLTVSEIELDRGRAAQGLRMSSEAYRILQQTLPAGHYAISVARCRRGRGLWASGQLGAGLEDLEAASSALHESTLDPDHRYVIECSRALEEARAAVEAGAR